jgi:hypothetical protein
MDALDDQNRIPRGRVHVPKGLKEPLLDVLEGMGIHAQAIDYPGADLLVASAI